MVNQMGHNGNNSDEDILHIISPADREHTRAAGGGGGVGIAIPSSPPIVSVVPTIPSRQLKREQKRLVKEQKRVEKQLQKEEKRRRKQEEKEQRLRKKELAALSKSPKKTSLSLLSSKRKTHSSSATDLANKTFTLQTLSSSSPTIASTSPSKSFDSKSYCDHSQEETQEEEEEEEGDNVELLVFDGSDEEGEDSDGGEEDFVGNFEFTDNSNGKDFICMSPDDIFNEHASLCDDVVEILSVSQTIATTLLKHHKWNKDRLLIAYFENPRKVLDAAGVSLDTTRKEKDVQKLKEEDYGMCSVCTDTMTDDNSFSLGCGHHFCTDCWAGHLTSKIGDGESMGILCPSYKCPLVVEESIIRQLVSQEAYQKYVRLLLNSFVTNNERVKWCPAPGCGKAISGETSKSKWVKCVCGYRFCFECSNETHAPATCEHVRLWQQKMSDESETQNWISANTVDCPKCKCFIEKNGGCNHMTCRQCGHEFCWLCLRDWKGHNDFYTCNRYLKSQKKSEKKKKKKSSKKAKSRDQKELHRQALERYLHFYSRYLNHDKSRTSEKVREEAHNKMRQLQETEATMAEVKFIAAAAEKLQECRLALKYSYVVGYYLPEGHSSSKALFEYLQENLEKTTEQLTEVLEHGADRVRVIDLTRLIESRLENFLEWQFEDGK